nr:stanniocalcin-2 [Meriones unguiculatus]
MCAERLGQFVTLALVLATLDPARGTDATNPPEGPQDRGSQQKGRLSLQNTAEIQHCLVNAGDVGCGVFECFENNSCEIRGLHGICMTFLHNAGKFDAQSELNLLQTSQGVIVEMIHFKDLLLHEPYVDLVNLLLTCGEEVKEAVTHSVQAQCEQNWGGLCSILSFCTSNIQRPPTTAPEHQPLADGAQLSRPHHRTSGYHLTEASRGAKGERGSRSHPNANPAMRGGAGGQSAQGPSGSSEWEDEQSEYSDIRR